MNIFNIGVHFEVAQFGMRNYLLSGYLRKGWGIEPPSSGITAAGWIHVSRKLYDSAPLGGFYLFSQWWMEPQFDIKLKKAVAYLSFDWLGTMLIELWSYDLQKASHCKFGGTTIWCWTPDSCILAPILANHLHQSRGREKILTLTFTAKQSSVPDCSWLESIYYD